MKRINASAVSETSVMKRSLFLVCLLGEGGFSGNSSEQTDLPLELFKPERGQVHLVSSGQARITAPYFGGGGGGMLHITCLVFVRLAENEC